MEKIQNHVKVISRFILPALFTLGFAFSCTHKDHQKSAGKTNDKATEAGSDSTYVTAPAKLVKGPNEISILSYNVENFFDNIHDEGTEDYPFLPLAEKKKPEVQAFCKSVDIFYFRKECFEKNWDDAAVNFKLSQVGKQIKYIENGQGPDIIFMAEVENIRMVNRLVDEQLKDLGYQTRLLIHGPDIRGINPAILSKFPVKGQPILHIIPYKDSDPERLKYAKRSRGVLEATVILPNKKELTLLAVHFPSQSNPTEWRAQAMEFVKNKMNDYAKEGRAVILGGDMNTVASEDEQYGYFSKILSQAGQVSHLVGCKDCQGTEFYHGHWSFLDVMDFGNKISVAGLELEPETIDTVRSPFGTKSNGTPLRFDEVDKEGVSDHFPIYARLKIQN